MTETTPTPAPTDEIAGAYMVKLGEEPETLALAESAEVLEESFAGEAMTFRPATRADVEAQGFEVVDGKVAAEVVENRIVPVGSEQLDAVDPAPVEVATAGPAKKGRGIRRPTGGTVTDRARRAAAAEETPAE